jgi:Rrf2 family protein
MRYTTKTEYGLVCMIYMAQHQDCRSTIKEIAKKENYPPAYIEKIIQALRQGKLVVSHQGNQGGYRLAKDPSKITLKEIIGALEGSTFDVFCEPKVREDIVCNHICLCGAKPVWKKTKEILDHFYGSVTLEMLAKNPAEAMVLIAHAG